MFIAEGKGGHQRLIPVSARFFDHLAAYLDTERPAGVVTDQVFLVLKGPRRGQPLTAYGLDEVLEGARRRAGLAHATCHQLRHTCLTRLREAGMALEAVQARARHASIESTRACVLRPGSVGGADLALRSFAAFLVECAPNVASVADVLRRHVEDYKPWLAARPGQHKPRVTPATIAHRLGTLRMFFVRIDEWGWPEAPVRVPMFNGDLPRLDHPLPKALDDATAAKLLRAAQNDRKPLVRVTVEVLLRTGLRVGEYVALPADAVVQIGAAPWLHVPVGKLHDDRYLPLHPNLVALIDDYRSRYVPAGHPLLLPRPNGTALDRHAVTRMINRAGKAAGLPHIHPHQLRHTLATQAINRGMSLEAIAAMLGHRSMDMTLRYAKIANRTVADEYFAVTDRVEALYGQQPNLPADAIGPKMARLRREHHRLLGNGYCTRPAELDCAFESICENCTFFQTSIEFRPTLQAQHDHAANKGQHHRANLFGRLLNDLNNSQAS